MSKQLHTPGPWEYRDAVGAGLQIHGVLPAGLKFDATCRDADGNTSFMLYTLRQAVVVGIGDARWVQFETGQWKEMQEANARLIAAAPELLAACEAAMRIEALWSPPAVSAVANEDEAIALEAMRHKFVTAIAKATAEPRGGKGE